MAEVISAAMLPDLLVRRLAGRAGTVWIGVDGFGAAGKSTLARAIAEALPGAVIVRTDDFPASADAGGWNQDRFVREVVEPLRAGRAARYGTWDLVTDTPGSVVELPAGVPVIIDGVSSTDVALPVPWDLTIWVEAPEELRWQRILARDPAELIARWRQEWLPSERAYGQAQQPWRRVDIVVVPTPVSRPPRDSPGRR
jgi:uridine kinase